jgi:outer membrane protein assembly factor BamE (lipoprotein component of BamABCDE complex)
MEALPGHNQRQQAGGTHGSARVLGRLISVLLILSLPVLLGAWQDVTGNTINPNYVKRIENGKTSKHEILLYFGDPKEIEKTEEGPVYKYFSYKDAPAGLPYRHEQRKIQEQSDKLYLDDDKQIKKVPVKTEGKILRSTLTIRFKADGVTVMSHEYKEF